MPPTIAQALASARLDAVDARADLRDEVWIRTARKVDRHRHASALDRHHGDFWSLRGRKCLLRFAAAGKYNDDQSDSSIGT